VEGLMATPRTRLRLVLLQIRNHRISLAQEQSCFIERCRVARRQFTFINLAEEPDIRWSHVADAHAVIIGGAGAFSVTAEHAFSVPLTEIVHRLIDHDRPVFGSCWGHQFLASRFGGEVIADEERSEVGSFPVTLTPEGTIDPLFAGLPGRFFVQLGHKDRVSVIGDDWVELARSERCPFQAIRLRGKPVYGTQFHGEMDEERLRERLLVYFDDYVADEKGYREILRRLRPSLEADSLLQTFLELYA
jgi:GMP synthase (glutamine-hydrolysing)